MKLRTCRVKGNHPHIDFCFTAYQIEDCLNNNPKFYIVGERKDGNGKIGWYCLYHETLAGHDGNLRADEEVRVKDRAEVKKLVNARESHMWWVEVELIKDIKEHQIMLENE